MAKSFLNKRHCAVLKENIFVCSGRSVNHFGKNLLYSYDVFADKWLPMLNKTNHKGFHSLVVLKDKFFVLGDYKCNCEVFNNNCKKCVALSRRITLVPIKL